MQKSKKKFLTNFKHVENTNFERGKKLKNLHIGSREQKITENNAKRKKIYHTFLRNILKPLKTLT